MPFDRSELDRWLAALAVYRRPLLIAIFVLGFSSGLPLALTGATLSIWLTEAGVSRTVIGAFALVGTAYALKFLWAPLIDRLPVPWLTRRLGRRRGWIVATHLACLAAIVGLGFAEPAVDPWLTAVLAAVVAFTSASQDIVIDAYRVEVLEEHEYGAGAAMVVFGFRVGMLVSGAGALYLASVLDWATVYAIMGSLLLIGVATALLCPEPPSAEAEAEAEGERLAGRVLGGAVPDWARRAAAWVSSAVVAPFADFMTRPGWLAILGFIMLYKFGDALLAVMANPFYVDMGFSLVDIANVTKLFGFGATLAGIFLGGLLVARFGIVPSLLFCGVLQLFSNLAFVPLAMAGPDLALLAFVVGFENLAGGMGTAAFVAYLSSLCNVAYTATQYALLSSFMAVARTFLSAPGGWLADQVDWVAFFLMTGVAAVPGLILLVWMTRRFPAPRTRAEEPVG